MWCVTNKTQVFHTRYYAEVSSNQKKLFKVTCLCCKYIFAYNKNQINIKRVFFFLIIVISPKCKYDPFPLPRSVYELRRP